MDWEQFLKDGVPIKVEHQVVGAEGLEQQINQVKWMSLGLIALGIGAWYLLRRKR
jgi:LPXTG-motif cell wall-anchored protein